MSAWKMQEILFFCTLSAGSICNKGKDHVSIFTITTELIQFICLIDQDMQMHLKGCITSNQHLLENDINMKLHSFNEMNETIKYDLFCNVSFKA